MVPSLQIGPEEAARCGNGSGGRNERSDPADDGPRLAARGAHGPQRTTGREDTLELVTVRDGRDLRRSYVVYDVVRRKQNVGSGPRCVESKGETVTRPIAVGICIAVALASPAAGQRVDDPEPEGEIPYPMSYADWWRLERTGALPPPRSEAEFINQLGWLRSARGSDQADAFERLYAPRFGRIAPTDLAGLYRLDGVRGVGDVTAVPDGLRMVVSFGPGEVTTSVVPAGQTLTNGGNVADRFRIPEGFRLVVSF